MATTKRERVSSSSSEDIDVVECDGVDRDVGVIRRPKRKVKKIKKKNKSSPPSNAPAAGTSKSSGDASCSAEKLSKEDDNEDVRCPICLCEFGPEVAFPDSCEHKFCSGCILEWAKKVNTCPIDRSEFKYVLILNRDSSELCERIEISKRFPKVQLVNPNLATACIICDREENLLTCCECYRSFHASCLFITLENGVQNWRCPYCVSQEHDGLPVEYPSPNQLRALRYHLQQVYMDRVRMRGTYARQQEPLTTPRSPSSVQNLFPFYLPSVADDRREMARFETINLLLSFFQDAVQREQQPVTEQPTPHPPSSVQLSEPGHPPIAMVEANIELSPFDLSSAESSSDERHEVTRAANSMRSFFRNAVELLPGENRSPSTTSVSSTTSNSSSSEEEEEDYRVAGSSGSLLNPIHLSSDSSDDEFSSHPALNDLNEELSTSQQRRPHHGSNRSSDAPSLPNFATTLRLRFPPEDNLRVWEDFRIIQEGHRPNSNAVHSGHGSSQSAVPYIYGGRCTMVNVRNKPMNQEARRSSTHPLLPPREDTHVIEEGSRRNTTAMRSGHISNNSHRPNGLAENPYGSLRGSRQPAVVAVSNDYLGGSSRLIRHVNLTPELANPAPIIQQYPLPVSHPALRGNRISVLDCSPSVITRSCISHTNHVDTVPENSRSSFQRLPARSTTRQLLIVPKPSPSNSSTTNGS